MLHVERVEEWWSDFWANAFLQLNFISILLKMIWLNINILQNRLQSNGSSHSVWIWQKRMLNWARSVSSTFWFTCQFFLASALDIVLYLRDHTRRNCTKIKVRRNCIWHTYVITALVCSVCRITSLTLCKIPCCFLCFKTWCIFASALGVQHVQRYRNIPALVSGYATWKSGTGPIMSKKST